MKGEGCNKPAIVEDKKQSSINRLKIYNKGNKNERETSGDLNQDERGRLMVDNGKDIQVRRVFITNLPPAQPLEEQREVVPQEGT